MPCKDFSPAKLKIGAANLYSERMTNIMRRCEDNHEHRQPNPPLDMICFFTARQDKAQKNPAFAGLLLCMLKPRFNFCFSFHDTDFNILVFREDGWLGKF